MEVVHVSHPKKIRKVRSLEPYRYVESSELRAVRAEPTMVLHMAIQRQQRHLGCWTSVALHGPRERQVLNI